MSSVKLAVPLLLVVAAVVAWGTVVESKYNAEMARIVVYNSTWFTALMGLLWLNILFATLSRYPFKKHHTGFVITHLGLLLTLGGGVLTTQYGIDGTLAVTEGDTDNVVALSGLAFGLAPEGSSNYKTIEIKRRLSPTTDFSSVNKVMGHIARVEEYLPFAEVNSTYKAGTDSLDFALSFVVKSNFFNVAEFLHSRLSPSKQMGPATFELREGSPGVKTAKSKVKLAKATPPSHTSEDLLQILSGKDGKVLHQIPLAELKKTKRLKFENLEIELKKAFRYASVSNGGLAEAEGTKLNPALELSITQKGKTHREVVFARFPGFSLSREPAQEYKFKYASTLGAADKDEDQAASAESDPTAPSMGATGSHVVRFYVDPEKKDQAQLEMIKDGKVDLLKTIHTGETIQTPWMGMQVTLASVIPHAEPVNDVRAVEPHQREDLPMGALKLLPNGGGDPVWLPEGERRDLIVNGRTYSAYFGRKMFRLPFTLHLKKFYKKDYPGTETAMSFESDVAINNGTHIQKISMNEPMVQQGYTIYQSSYQMNPNGPALSVFSVNYDPGRPFKYGGSLVLCFGIVTFVVQRSSLYKKWQKRKA